MTPIGLKERSFGILSMKSIMILGLGSMGCRRARLLKKLRPEITLCAVDSNEPRREQARAQLGIATYASMELAIQLHHPTCAVISTPPLTHAGLIRKCLDAGLHVFTEMNLVSEGYEENMALAREKQRVLFLSSTFLYRGETRYLIQKAQASSSKISWRYHVGQYLPDWHPWEDYRQYFIGREKTNGCRELFAIELPWLCAAFGPITQVKTIHQKNSALEIGFDDSYMVLIEHATGHQGCLCVDVVSRKPVRRFEMYSETSYLTWEGEPSSLREYDPETKTEKTIAIYSTVEHQNGYAAFVVENAYSDELLAFLSQVEDGIPAPYSFLEDRDTLRWIDRIEQKEA